MRWLLCHRVCWNFVQWICFTGSRAICMSLYLWNLPCNITSFWLLGYLTAVQFRKLDTTIDWEEFKDYSADCSHAKHFQFPWQTCCLLKKATQQQRNLHLYRLRCALFVVLSQGHGNLGQAQLSLTCRNAQ